MASEKIEFKRVGPPKVTAKDARGYLTVQISLDGNPDYTWIEDCFKHPQSYKPNEAYSGRAMVVGNTITFNSHESNIRQNVEWMDNYIQQANNCYNKKRTKQIAEQKRLLEEERRRQEEIAKINESIRDL